jgi:putative GTP pyrophosphokinase
MRVPPREPPVRTIAMDFWASLEHKIYYKYDGHIPPGLVASLTEAAHLAEELDQRVEELNTEVRGAGWERVEDDAPGMDEQMLMRLWHSARTDGDGSRRPADWPRPFFEALPPCDGLKGHGPG